MLKNMKVSSFEFLFNSYRFSHMLLFLLKPPSSSGESEDFILEEGDQCIDRNSDFESDLEECSSDDEVWNTFAFCSRVEDVFSFF